MRRSRPLSRHGLSFSQPSEGYVITGICVKIKQSNHLIALSSLLSDSNRIQTYNLLIRSQMLYSVELWSRCLSQLRCKGIAFF